MISCLVAVGLDRFLSSELIQIHFTKNIQTTKVQCCISSDNNILHAQDLSAQVVLFDYMFNPTLLCITDALFPLILEYFFFNIL